MQEHWTLRSLMVTFRMFRRPSKYKIDPGCLWTVDQSNQPISALHARRWLGRQGTRIRTAKGTAAKTVLHLFWCMHATMYLLQGRNVTQFGQTRKQPAWMPICPGLVYWTPLIISSRFECPILGHGQQLRLPSHCWWTLLPLHLWAPWLCCCL